MRRIPSPTIRVVPYVPLGYDGGELRRRRQMRNFVFYEGDLQSWATSARQKWKFWEGPFYGKINKF
jgi:hypothetical protein